jgi:hypothetical protein
MRAAQAADVAAADGRTDHVQRYLALAPLSRKALHPREQRCETRLIGSRTPRAAVPSALLYQRI